MARNEYSYHVATEDFGKVKIHVIDRINVDDVFHHLVQRELWRLAGGEDPGIEVDREYKDFLIRAGHYTR